MAARAPDMESSCNIHRSEGQRDPFLFLSPVLREKKTCSPQSYCIKSYWLMCHMSVPHDWLRLPKISEKAMATHSSTLAWKIPWTEEPGGLQSMGSLRVGLNWATSLSLFTFMHWRRQWQPTPVFLPGESQGRGSLAGCCLWGRTGSDTTDTT